MCRGAHGGPRAVAWACALAFGSLEARADLTFEQRRDCRLPETGDPGAVGPAGVICALQPISPVPGDSAHCCTGRGGPRSTFSRRADCPAEAMAAVTTANPDSIVVLGAGHMSSGAMGCHGVQRAHMAFQVFEAVGRSNPAFRILMSGGNATTQEEPLEEPDRLCVLERVERRLLELLPGSPTADPASRCAALPVTAANRNLLERCARHGRLQSPGASSKLTEADQMCGAFLRHYPDSDGKREALSRIDFEADSMDTVANAANSVGILRRNRSRRPMVVTTPVYDPDHVVCCGHFDDHATRAYNAFRSARAAAHASMSLTTLQCQFETSHAASAGMLGVRGDGVSR